MNFRYAHILYREMTSLHQKEHTFDHRTKTGFMTTWSTDHSAELLKHKYWNCLSAYGLESAMRRKITFERKHSDSNLLYFKYELEVPEVLKVISIRQRLRSFQRICRLGNYRRSLQDAKGLRRRIA